MSQKPKKSVITIGTFDGIHLGHRALFATARRLANSKNLKTIAYTFEKPPQNYFGVPKKLLMPPQKKLKLLQAFVDGVEVAHFPDVQTLSADQFVRKILIENLKMAAIVIGTDFRFGRDRQGSIQLLQKMSSELDFEVIVVDAVAVDDKPISSTAIRTALSSGDVKTANQFLGEPAHLWGRVVRGLRQASELGFPTANLEVDPEVLIPATGIYATLLIYKKRERPAALYIGNRPTFNGSQTSVEAYMLDEQGLQLYGEELEVRLFHRIRGDQRFDSVSELQRQIGADIEAVRVYFQNCEAS